MYAGSSTLAKRPRGQSLHLELPDGPTEDDAPNIAAVFLILFDAKAGYTVAWKRSVTGLQLEESVEFKSLPSGLHNVTEDLIYFVHDKHYAGISAFINKSSLDSERNALMLAVGALLPLSNGRLGRSWKHAAEIKKLAKTLSEDPGNTQALENYWIAYRILDEEIDRPPDLPTDSPIDVRIRSARRQSIPNAGGRRRNRTVSTVSALAASGQRLSVHHPAISLPSMIEVFGPLIFPLYKAALLRKRILLVTQAPVETACKYVYNLSVISSIPSSIAGVLPLEPLPLRLRSLFSVGVHDIHLLREVPPSHSTMTNGSGDENNLYGWIACTTDGILATKEKLYDMIVTMPPDCAKQDKERVWPKLQFSHDRDVKATQRDLRRYQTLTRGLRKWPSKSQAPSPQQENHGYHFTHNEEPGFLPQENNSREFYNDNISNADEKVVELSSWSSLAYSSFMWWASAGEKRTDLDEEVDHDAKLLRGNNESRNASPSRSISRPRSAMSHQSEQPPGLEFTLIAYFYRLTTLILVTLADIVELSEGETDEGVPGLEEVISISSEDVSRMGLDVWSAGDRRFVEELVELYWGRKAEVQGAKVECCGVRIY